ncbi:MAG: phosphoribosyltransferase [Nanoarchaeota archaeon]|nr:phosphoribosyltransferase [Thermodesulfovibrionia bacterium]MCK5283338.1 phosphoribosyltransferase [Nanoarchaeota archaeon]
MKTIEWNDFFERLDEELKKSEFHDFNIIVAIGNAGIIPAAFIQQRLKIPMKIIWIQYRDKENTPMYEDAKLIEAEFSLSSNKILLVDDVSRSGKTIATAKRYLRGNNISTFVVNGNGDYSLFKEKGCIVLPWKKSEKIC